MDHSLGIGRPNPSLSTRYRIAGHANISSGERIAFTTHCVDRWWERVASAANFRGALVQLTQLVKNQGRWVTQPGWVIRSYPNSTWLSLTDEIVLAVDSRYVARTCLVRPIIKTKRRPTGRKFA